MRLSEATWTEVADLDTDLALLPVGSTEQHGPHAPLGTDFLNAESVAEAGAAAFDGDVLVGPTIPVGVAEEHRAFDGTLWVSPNTFRAYVRETIESLAHHGFDRVVVVNGHGGNIEALAELCRRVSRAGDAYTVSFTWFNAVGEHSSDMGHGGPLETALLRHTHPELVREDRIEEAQKGGSDRWGEWVSGVNLAHDSAEFTDNGVVGDPADGDADRGEELESLVADALASLLAAVEKRNLN
ncbi:creatininase family protein [Haloferax mediterranei ATCC 33500]|uniref:Creatininase n=1 Tax=Haloferax mediterranei (strain ATCC 33500 / DSM 1411 / JCM 8866 / NBRC 14739 / NCIMB 2177 / R-4) TaxID=523841 RepID=I3R1V3_HALMT|nr:creatininase family protein [Haloferax mediterranei]AFK18213.1 creatininase [Haloferax mediterranei ATCC 33500]AHZ22384.1 creatininase [Haloferax mediterranei ATCC 33500]EMA02514.1 creatininase [Haloferax mediterranei ATCC 33500]MDX5988302.1 creatininase family protein [Haloferax mediterranei ATCC 33500]QCQ74737.1 creatininase family protein [Haloferax mediterranei ATCC 33500]